MPVDEAAAAIARPRGELAAWLASVSGEERPASRMGAHTFGIASVSFGAPRAVMSVPEVAQAVDAGREAAVQDAAQGAVVVAGYVQEADGDALAQWLLGRAPDPEIRGPLGALRRLGDRETAMLAGLALGAGERGLGYVCDGLAAVAAAAIAVAVEPDLRPRVRAADRSCAELLDHVGLAWIVERGGLKAAFHALHEALA